MSIFLYNKALFKVGHTPCSLRASKAFKIKNPPLALKKDPVLILVKSVVQRPNLSKDLSIVPNKFL